MDLAAPWLRADSNDYSGTKGRSGTNGEHTRADMHKRRDYKRDVRDKQLATAFARIPENVHVEGIQPCLGKAAADALREAAPSTSQKGASRDKARAEKYRKAKAAKAAAAAVAAGDAVASAASPNCTAGETAAGRAAADPQVVEVAPQDGPDLVGAAGALLIGGSGEVRQPPPRLVVDWTSVPPSIDPSSGNLDEGRACRKRQQLESAAAYAATLLRPGQTCVDFGAGSGHLGLLLAHLFDDIRVILVENADFRVAKAKERLGRADPGLAKRVQMFDGTLEEFAATDTRFDLAVW